MESAAFISKDNYLENSDRQREKELTVVNDSLRSHAHACANCIELMKEIQRIRNEKEKVTKNLEDTFQIIKAHKEKELELQKEIENNTTN